MTVKHDRSYFVHLLIQPICASVILFAVLYCLDLVNAGTLIWAAGASTLASTCFIVFGAPNTDSAKPYRILVSYLIAMVCGHLVRLVTEHICVGQSICHDPAYSIHLYELAAVISLAIAFIILLLMKCSHPPAAGLSVVMVLDITNVKAMVIIYLGALVIALVRLIFYKHLKPLI